MSPEIANHNTFRMPSALISVPTLGFVPVAGLRLHSERTHWMADLISATNFESYLKIVIDAD